MYAGKTTFHLHQIKKKKTPHCLISNYNRKKISNFKLGKPLQVLKNFLLQIKFTTSLSLTDKDLTGQTRVG